MNEEDMPIQLNNSKTQRLSTEQITWCTKHTKQAPYVKLFFIEQERKAYIEWEDSILDSCISSSRSVGRDYGEGKVDYTPINTNFA